MPVYFAPGRVNLIGEHTDYNGGFVFPCALDFGTRLTLTANSERLLRFRSLNMAETVDLSIDQPFRPLPNHSWANYPLGSIAVLMQQTGCWLEKGYDLLFEGTVPLGAGLSSSASIEVVTAYAFNDILQLGLSPTQLALVAQQAEHTYAGVNCGIMDQFISANGKQDNAVFLNCDTLQFDYVPLHLDDVSIVLTNSHSPHKLDAGTYNQRVKECQQAVEIISRHKPIRQLADLTVSDFQEIQSTITDPVILRRARHVVTEIQRTRDAVKALRNNDLATFGQLMNQSHQSLRDDYEVTGQELDTLAQTAWQIPGVIGSRMTGGGFGGCTVSLVRNDAIGRFQQTVGDTYRQTTGLQAEFYIAHTGDGARTLQQ